MADENKKLDAWIAENVTEDTKEVMIIGNTASEEALSKLNIGLSAEMALSLYGIVYAEIIDKLRNLRSDNPSFIIQIANIVAIGYDNTEEDEDTETQGNFNIVMQEIDLSVKKVHLMQKSWTLMKRDMMSTMHMILI